MTHSHAHAAPRVLVVDDNATLVVNLTEILQDAGYQVRSAASCRGALDAAREAGREEIAVCGIVGSAARRDSSPGGEPVTGRSPRGMAARRGARDVSR